MTSPPSPDARAARRNALGCAAGLLLASVASWVRLAAERSLAVETSSPGFLVAAAVAGAGLALAGACGLKLARLASALSWAELAGWALAVHGCAFLALPLTSRDLFSNLGYGYLQLAGASPYLAGPRAAGLPELAALLAPRWADAPSVYGPVVSALSAAAAWVGAAARSPVWVGGLAFKALMAACALAAVALLRDPADPEEQRHRLALVAFSPLLAWELSAQAHNDAVLVLALAGFLWAARRGHEALAVLALVAGVLAKSAAAPVLLLYLVIVARRAPRRACALALLALVAAAALYAPYWRGAVTLRGPAVALGGGADRHAHSLADLAALALGGAGASPALLAAVHRGFWVLSTAACGLALAHAAWRARTLDDVVRGGWRVFLVFSLTAPWFQPWYASWLLPLAAAERDADLRRLLATYAAWTVVLWAAPIDPVTTVALDAWVAWRWLRLRARAAVPAVAVDIAA